MSLKKRIIKFLFSCVISVSDTILFYIGGFAIFYTIAYLLLIFNFDFLRLSNGCEYASLFNKSRQLYCEILTNKGKLLLAGIPLIVFWLIFVPVFKINNKHYNNSFKEIDK
jgi:hypothetical protein